jgi:outer membrane lipoprotein SlyB
MNSKVIRNTSLVTLAVTLTVLGGCASSLSNRAYERGQARQTQEVHLGVVSHVRDVEIEGTKSRAGAGAGVLVGAAIGSKAGKEGSVSRAVGTVAGAVAGGIGGAAAEEGMTRQHGLEITVKLDSGQMLAVTQAADESFLVGDRVRVLTAMSGTARVTH